MNEKDTDVKFALIGASVFVIIMTIAAVVGLILLPFAIAGLCFGVAWSMADWAWRAIRGG